MPWRLLPARRMGWFAPTMQAEWINRQDQMFPTGRDPLRPTAVAGSLHSVVRHQPCIARPMLIIRKSKG